MPFSSKADKVDWYVTDFYPCHILSGPQKGQGYCDKIVSGLIDRMDEFEHQVDFLSAPKLNEKVSKRDPLCTLSLLKTEERQRYLLYSDPVTAVLPNGLITLRDDKRFKPYMDQKNRIVLSKLVTDEKLILGRIKARSYGPKIDKVLNAEYAKYPRIMTTGGLPFIDLLKTGRIDYFISYPASALGKDIAVYDNHQTQFLSIYEDSQLYFPGVSCTKGKLGERVINQVNKHMSTLGIDYFSDAYEYWLPDSVKKIYRDLVKENTD
jgi:uncharacterized protein (TIGR02285 family)